MEIAPFATHKKRNEFTCIRWRNLLNEIIIKDGYATTAYTFPEKNIRRKFKKKIWRLNFGSAVKNENFCFQDKQQLI